MTYITVNSHELEQGDIVNCHGMRCLIDGEPQVSRSHPTNEHSPTIYYRALVLDRPADSPVPLGWLERDSTGRESGELRWTIQGNKLATWAVEKPNPEHAARW